ncbi:peritrophin-1-like, partial [Rhipicephalus microplus]|uniref:peritrophin-1-like n=1 Tax=Rhipicephalus microplus TaxID=6941 RepID=UPI003F6BCE6F
MVTQRRVVLSSVALVTLSLVSMSSALAILACPPVDDRNDDATLFANPLNCSTFFLCQQGIPVLMECPDNLHFNDDLKVCDYPVRANCVQRLPTFPPVL